MQSYSYVKNRRHGYPFYTGRAAVSAPANMQLRLHSVACVNGSASTTNMGISYSLASGSAVFSASGGAATPYVNGAYLGTVGQQLYFQSILEIPDFVAFVNSSNGSGGTPTYTVEYWSGAWTTITPQAAPDFTKESTGLIIGAPLDWVKGSGGVAGLNSTWWTFRITVTSVPVTVAQSSSIQVCKLILYREQIEAKQGLEVSFEENQLLLAQGQNIIPYFSNLDIHNSVELAIKFNP